MPLKSMPVNTRRTKSLPLWLLIFFGVIVLIFIAAGSLLGILLGYEYNLPKIQSLEDYRPDVITAIYSDDNKVIGEFAVERRIIVTLEDIPPYLQAAILAAEDDQFYDHSGINYFSIMRAAYKDLLTLRKSEGASTITQQLARMLLLSSEKSFDRKIKEALLAWKIERQYSKKQILTLYCNQHYMGHGAYGVAAASDTYFGKQLKDLTLEECATIAGLPRNPALYSPRLHPDTALARRNYILDRMVAERMISLELAAEAKAKPIVLKQGTREWDMAPYFVEWVRQALAERYATDVIWRQGLRVYSTLNIEMQKSANEALHEGLRSYDKKRGWRGPIENILKTPSNNLETYSHPDWRSSLRTGDIVVGLVQSVSDSTATVRIGKYRAQIGPKEIAWTAAKSPSQILKTGDLAEFLIVALDNIQKTASILLEQKPNVEGAIITIQNSTGEIRAMVGGYDYEASEFNRATQAMRQVGSTFKPFVYSAALEKGMTPDSVIVDTPISFTDALGRIWRPSNYDGKFKGQITLRQAITESRNIPAIKIASLVGIKNVLVMARRFGLMGPMEPYLPLALGACEATPLEMASAFATFPNLGLRAKPYFIKRIEDYEHQKKEESAPQVHKVLDPEIAEKMLSLLQNVVQNGTATAAKSLGRPIGGKTGTTNDFTDAWFVGFTPSITTAVWIGFDEKVTLGNKETGAAVALPIWINHMKSILKDKPIEEFPATEMTNQMAAENPDSSAVARKKLFIEELPGSTSASPGPKKP
jgi:penicillin-binding protein 1A